MTSLYPNVGLSADLHSFVRDALTPDPRNRLPFHVLMMTKSVRLITGGDTLGRSDAAEGTHDIRVRCWSGILYGEVTTLIEKVAKRAAQKCEEESWSRYL
jgi:hypothetical protein